MKKIIPLFVVVLLVSVALVYFYYDNKDVVISIEATVVDVEDPSGKLPVVIAKGEKVSGRLHIPYMLWKSDLGNQRKEMAKYILPGGEASFLFHLGAMSVVSNNQSESTIEIINDVGSKKEDYFLIRFHKGVIEGVETDKVSFALQLHDADGDALSSKKMPMSFDISKWSGGKSLDLSAKLKSSESKEAESRSRGRRAQSLNIHSTVMAISVLKN